MRGSCKAIAGWGVLRHSVIGDASDLQPISQDDAISRITLAMTSSASLIRRNAVQMWRNQSMSKQAYPYSSKLHDPIAPHYATIHDQSPHISQGNHIGKCNGSVQCNSILSAYPETWPSSLGRLVKTTNISLVAGLVTSA
jgi:hypothetical protein